MMRSQAALIEENMLLKQKSEAAYFSPREEYVNTGGVQQETDGDSSSTTSTTESETGSSYSGSENIMDWQTIQDCADYRSNDTVYIDVNFPCFTFN